MSAVTIILAAHGSGDGSDANLRVHRLANALTADADASVVLAAFRKGRPSFADALDAVTTPRVVVVPVMTSEGYFTNNVLPAALAESPRFSEFDVCITPPLGMHPRMVDIAGELMADAARRCKLTAAETTVIIVGHGTRQHAGSRSRTDDVAAALGKRNPDWRIAPAFLDESPCLAEIVATQNRRNLIAVPFLIGGGHHATVDIPKQLGIGVDAIAAGAPFVNDEGGTIRICTSAVGMHARIPSLVRDVARSAVAINSAGAI